MKSIFTFLFLSFCSLLQPTKLYAQLGQCPTCKKAIANCIYKGRHPEPSVKISFSSSDASHPMLLYIDGVKKDSITAYPGGSYSCNLKYGTHTIVANALDMEDYKESITVNKNTASWHPIKAERAFSGKNALQIKTIGDYYANGSNGRIKNQDEACIWYEKAAEKGDASAGYSAGMILIKRRRNSDVERAVELFHVSAEQGIKESQYELGRAYYYGDGLDKNYKEALKWFEKAASQNHIEAWFYVGVVYYHARGVDRDYAKAMDCFKKSTDYKVAQHFIGYMYEEGLGVQANMNIAKDWYLKAALQGYAPAQKSLGDYYTNTSMILKTDSISYIEEKKGKTTKFNGHFQGTVGKNYKEAAMWYQKAADQENAEAQKSLADLYVQGKGLDKDTLKAINLYRKAVSNFALEEDYQSAYSAGKILISLDKKEYLMFPANYKKDYSIDLGRHSFHALLVKEFSEAELLAREGIAADDSQQWIYTNLAASLLFQGRFSEAEKIYTQWKDRLKTGFLDDFRIFENRNMLSVEQKSEIEKIKNMLKE